MTRRLLAMALVCASLLAFPAVASAAVPISVVVFTGMSCVSGTGPASSEVIATLRTPGGHVRGRFRSMTDGAGNWDGCFPLSAINGNDQMRLLIGNRSRTVRIPRLEPEIDRVADTITGWVRPGDVVFADIGHAVNLRDMTAHTFADQANGNGRYVIDTSSEVDLRGGDAVTIFAPHGDDTFGAFVIVPHVNVSHANNFLNGTANNGTDLVFVLTNRDGKLKADTTAGTSSALFGISLFTVDLYRANGAAAYPVATDLLASNLASDAVLRIPNGTLAGNPATDVVTGRCMKNAPYALGIGGEGFFGTTNANGEFARDVTNRMNLRRADQLELTCLYATGDTWFMTNIAR